MVKTSTSKKSRNKASRIRDVQTQVNRNVFLNCPFDKSYEDCFLALVAAVVTQGLTPRTVLDQNVDKTRIERLFDVMNECDRSIHDISRVTLSGSYKAPRFNMPFELGMCFGLHFVSGRRHKAYAMEAESFRAMHSTSDLNGYDIPVHQNNPVKIFSCVKSMFRLEERAHLGEQEFKLIFAALRKNKKNLKVSNSLFNYEAVTRIQLATAKLIGDL